MSRSAVDKISELANQNGQMQVHIEGQKQAIEQLQQQGETDRQAIQTLREELAQARAQTKPPQAGGPPAKRKVHGQN